MLLRDEQWREHDRLAGQHEEHTGELEEQITDLAATVRQMQAVDATRMQALLNVIHELAAEYDASYMKVR
jgi:Asp-tRNA(Asn)/Glu-tRNA(Gln) amidotransferase C subunit